jgi:hypothetical protein
MRSAHPDGNARPRLRQIDRQSGENVEPPIKSKVTQSCPPINSPVCVILTEVSIANEVEESRIESRFSAMPVPVSESAKRSTINPGIS